MPIPPDLSPACRAEHTDLETVPPKLEELDRDGRVYWGKDGNSNPYLKRFLSEVKDGRVAGSIWSPDDVGYTRNGKEDLRVAIGAVESAFASPKPEKLLVRVIGLASEPGDIVLDCFAGSGTTAAVAHKMGRKWVTIELSQATIDRFTRPRLERAVAGVSANGTTNNGLGLSSGGFRMATVGLSLYERVGHWVLLADWAKGEEFAQSVAAQLGFWYAPDGPFAGIKGRARLAVVDGIADDVVVKSIVSYLEDDERATVVAKGSAPGTEQVLRELSSGSRLLKAPTDLVRRGRVIR